MYRFLFLCISIVVSSFCLYSQVSYKWTQVLPASDSIAYRLEEVAFYDENRSGLGKDIGSLYALAEDNKDQALFARALYWDAWKEMQSDVDEASKLINRALLLVDSVQYPYDHIRFQSMKGDVLRKSGQWLEAYHIYKEQKDYFEKAEDWFYLAKTYVALGVLFNELKEYSLALGYFETAQEYFGKVGSDNCFIKNKINISNVMYCLGNMGETIHILLELQEDPVVIRDTNYLINVMISYFTVSDDADKIYREKAYQLAIESEDKSLITKTLMGKGAYFLMNNQNDSALYYYKQAEDLIDQYTNTYDNFAILRNLSAIYQKEGNTDSAHYYLRKYVSESEKILAQEKIQELNRLESRSTIEQYELEISRNEEKVSQQRRINRIILIASLGVILLIAYIFRLSRKKDNIKKQLKETENKNLMLENKQLQVELDSRNRELTSNILTLSAKNKGLKVLLEKVETLTKSKAIPEKESTDLKKQIKQQLSSDDEWKYFKLHFEKVHPDFFTNLKNRYPNLSQNDLRLCAYIRIGMTNKEIAQLWSVLPETIITTRYRLRKKLGLEHDESLEDLLQS